MNIIRYTVQYLCVIVSGIELSFPFQEDNVAVLRPLTGFVVIVTLCDAASLLHLSEIQRRYRYSGLLQPSFLDLFVSDFLLEARGIHIFQRELYLNLC